LLNALQKFLLIDYLNNIYETLSEIRKICLNSIDVCISIVNFITSIKKLNCFQNDDNTIIKFIYITMTISWIEYEQDLYKIFSSVFNLKFKKFLNGTIRSVIDIGKKESTIVDFINLKISYLNYLGDNIIMLLCIDSIQGNSVYMRVNIRPDLKNSLNDYEYLFLNNESIISIHNTDLMKLDVFIRNPISSCTISINMNYNINDFKLGKSRKLSTN
jgi:hypothetical protein